MPNSLPDPPALPVLRVESSPPAGASPDPPAGPPASPADPPADVHDLLAALAALASATDQAGSDRMKNPLEPIMQFFQYHHLPPHLQVISRPFAALALALHDRLRRSPERTVMLRKLLESKDAAVRASMAAGGI